MPKPFLASFRGRDLPQLISLLNETEKNLRDFRPYTKEEVESNILQDEAFDPKGLRLTWDRSRLVGAALAIVDPEYVRFQKRRRGFLRWIRVRKNQDPGGVKKSLLRSSLRFIETRNMVEAQVSVASHNLGDLSFYRRNGFKLIRKFNYMERILPELPAKLKLPAGHNWTHFKRGEEKEWVGCINTAFKNHWGKRPTSPNEFSRWTSETSFDPTGVIGIRRKGSLIGVIYCEIDASYAEYTGRKRSMLWIIGVIPSARGLGLGEALTLRGMSWSRSKGMRIAALYVDSENRPALQLYRKLKFKTAYQVQHLLQPLRNRAT